MKRPVQVILSSLFLVTSFLSQAQQGGSKPVVKSQGSKPAVKKPATAPKFLKNLNDSASYVIGMSMANFSRQFGLKGVDTALLAKGFTDALAAQQTMINENACFSMLNHISSAAFILPEDNVPSGSTTPLRNFIDSASYAIGMDRANFLRQQGVTKMNVALVKRGFDDLISNKPVYITDAGANMVMNKLITNLQFEKVQPNIDAGKKFLAANKKKKGVITTKSGLQYEVIKKGTGARPTILDTFVAHYRGTLLDGTEFDASYNRNEPLRYGVNQVIKGWIEGLQLMQVGAKYKLYIPYNLAYGVFDNPPIPGGSLLIFEMELLDVRKKR